jgi:hypothetical protein
MPKLFGLAIDQIIHRELSPGLLKGTLYRDINGVRNANDPTAGPVGGSTTAHSFKGIIQYYRDNEVDNELVLKEDRKILIIAKSIKPAIVPEIGMRVQMSDNPGNTFQVVRVNRDPASATYLCQGRL